jgi:hypothetical protein
VFPVPQLTLAEIAVLLESLSYSKMNVENAPGTPSDVRRENIARVEGAMLKVRAIRDALNAADLG